MTTTNSTLLALRPGDRARVTGFDGPPAFTSRLQAMGLLEDEELEVVRIAPLGDPIAIKMAGGQITLRKREAECVKVELIITGGGSDGQANAEGATHE